MLLRLRRTPSLVLFFEISPISRSSLNIVYIRFRVNLRTDFCELGCSSSLLKGYSCTVLSIDLKVLITSFTFPFKATALEYVPNTFYAFEGKLIKRLRDSKRSPLSIEIRNIKDKSVARIWGESFWEKEEGGWAAGIQTHWTKCENTKLSLPADFLRGRGNYSIRASPFCRSGNCCVVEPLVKYMTWFNDNYNILHSSSGLSCNLLNN